jgi:hypothetical protein
MQYRLDGPWHVDVPADVLAAEPKLGMSQQVPNIGIAAGDKIIQAEDLPAFVEHQVAEMRAEEARTACYHRAQSCDLLSDSNLAAFAGSLSPSFFTPHIH